MTYSIVYDAIQIKITRFEKPAPLINLNELAAAIVISYRQAGITPPALTTGISVDELRQTFFETIGEPDSIDPKLLTSIKEYPNEKQLIDEAALQTYQFGLNYDI